MSRLLLVAAGALALGIGTAEYLTKNFPFRQWIGEVSNRLATLFEGAASHVAREVPLRPSADRDDKMRERNS